MVGGEGLAVRAGGNGRKVAKFAAWFAPPSLICYFDKNTIFSKITIKFSSAAARPLFSTSSLTLPTSSVLHSHASRSRPPSNAPYSLSAFYSPSPSVSLPLHSLSLSLLLSSSLMSSPYPSIMASNPDVLLHDKTSAVYYLAFRGQPTLTRVPPPARDAVFSPSPPSSSSPLPHEFTIPPSLPHVTSGESPSLAGVEISMESSPIPIKWFRLSKGDSCISILLATGSVVGLYSASPDSLRPLSRKLSAALLSFRSRTTTIAVIASPDSTSLPPSPPPHPSNPAAAIASDGSADYGERTKDAHKFAALVYSLARDVRFYASARTSLLRDVAAYKRLVSVASGAASFSPPSSSPVRQPGPPLPLPTAASSTRARLAAASAHVAAAALVLPTLVALTKRIAAALEISTVGIGPSKTASRALEKANLKYGGDVSRVLDYSRTLLVCPDVPTLLAALEIARVKCRKPLVRAKLDSLVGAPLRGGFRHAVLNVALPVPGTVPGSSGGVHICEIQLATEAFYAVG